MRYAIMSKELAISQLQIEVQRCGGRNLRVALASKQIFCDLDNTEADKLKAIGCSVNKVEGVKAVIVPPVITPPIPIAAIPTYTPEALVYAAGFEEARELITPPLYGEGFTVAIIDSGILETHQKINSRVVYSKNYTTDLMRDGLDHGTGVCSIVLAVVPKCNILNMKVLDEKGEGLEEDVVFAIEDCIALLDTNPGIAPQLINLSLGAIDTGNPNDPLRVACRAANERRIWVSASAGNAGPGLGTITSPACERYVFATGSAILEPFEISDWSSRGPTKEGLSKPDAVFFGENVQVASSKGDTATIAKSGTSFATPFNTGIAILYHEATLRYSVVGFVAGVPPGVYEEYVPLLTMEDLLDEYLQWICVKPQGVVGGKDNEYGYGLPFGELVAKYLYRPVVLDIPTLMQQVMPLVGLAMLGMLIVPMTKGLK